MILSNKKNAATAIKTALRYTVSYAAISGMLIQPVLAAGALPSGGQVVAGDVTISTPSANETLVSQTSSKGIVNWNDFSVGQGNTVQFNNGTGATLNRVTGPTISSIDGKLSATGSVYLINSNGIVVGSTGVINTGGSFVASTLDTLDSDFLDGGDATFKGASKAAILNYGKVGSLGGDVALIAAQIDNEGSIEAPNGTAALAAGYEVLMRDASLADGKFIVKVGGTDTVARNAGTIKAADAELRANDGNVYALAGNLGGYVRAEGVSSSDGRVFLTDEGGTVTVDSAVNATKADGSGGTIVATGETVLLKSGAALSANGTKGGTVLVGGDQYGSNDQSRKLVSFDVANAGTVTVDAGATISANGSEAEGGKVVIWSDDFTDYKGALSTLGEGTQGGFAEVSSHGVLNFDGDAATGEGGELLLDPYNMTIVSGSGGSATATSNSSTLGADTLKKLLDGDGTLRNLFGNNVTVSTGTGTNGVTPQAGDITVASAVKWTSAHNLTLQAANNIAINATVTGASGLASLTLQGKNQITQTAAISVAKLDIENNGGAVATVLNNAGNSVGQLTAGSSGNRVGALTFVNSKSLNLGTAGLVGLGASGIYSNGDVDITASGTSSDVAVNWAMDTTGSSVNLTAGRNISINSGLIANAGDVVLTAGTGGGTSSISDGLTGSVSADGLALLGGSKVTATLDNQVLLGVAYSNVNTLAADVGSLSFLNGKALSIGSVGGADGITATGDINLFLYANNAGLDFDQALTTTGDVTITSNGAVTQSDDGIITADNLRFEDGPALLGTALSVDLTGQNLVNSIGAGTVIPVGDFNFTNAQSLTINKMGIASYGTVTVHAEGTGSNLTLASAGNNSIIDGVYSALTGNGTAITLAADGNFINNAGSNALQTGNILAHNARWLVYAGTSEGNTYGGLNSGNQAVWGTAYDDAVDASGNRYVFAIDTASTTLDVTLDDATKVYGSGVDLASFVTAASLEYTGHSAVANAYAGDVATSTAVAAADLDLTSDGTALTANVATYDVDASYGVYSVTLDNALTVTKKELTVVADDKSKVYGEDNPDFTVSYTGFVNDEDASVLDTHATASTTAPVNSNVGTYDITAEGGLDNNYSFIGYTQGTFSITAATLTVAANGQQKVYGDSDPELTYDVHGYQFDDGSSVLSGALTREDGRNVGAYDIAQGSLASNSNYVIAFTGAQLMIVPRSVTITADNAQKLIGDTDPALTWQITDGTLAYDDSVTGSVVRDAGELPADYAITQGDVALNDNYNLTFVDGDFTINPLTHPAGTNYVPGSGTDAPDGAPSGTPGGASAPGGDTTGAIVQNCDADNVCINTPYPTNTKPGDGITFASN